MRRMSVITSSVIATVVAFVGGISPAFATRVVPITDADAAGRSVSHSAGLAMWQTSLIVAASVVVLLAVATFAVRLVSHRTSVRPAVR